MVLGKNKYPTMKPKAVVDGLNAGEPMESPH